jgi:hypothetical protein
MFVVNQRYRWKCCGHGRAEARIDLQDGRAVVVRGVKHLVEHTERP